MILEAQARAGVARRLALALADQLGMPAPIAATVNAQYVAARQKGLSAADFAAVRSVYDP